ncbi:MAG: M56 family metallopeptidase [Ruminococcus sp.]|nr:M56 family metallopeptidase [Ruminococcus sp.]
MLFTFYSLLMAIIASSVMIIAIYFLKKTRYFRSAYSVSAIVLLYVFSLLRMFVSVEFPKIQTLIEDEYILAPVMSVLENRTPLTENLPILLLYILGIFSLIVTVVLITIFIVRQHSYSKKLSLLDDYSTKEETELLEKVAKKVFGKPKNIRLIKSDVVISPMVTGLFRNTVMIPNEEYSEKELSTIFLHECTHLKNNDLLLKLLVQIYCCVFWFNPFVYLLKADMDFTLELRCDNVACANMSEVEKLEYAECVNNSAKKALRKSMRATLVSSGFAMEKGTKEHIIRMKNLLKVSDKSSKIPIILLSVLLVIICALSYMFIWQPRYPSTPETQPDEYAGASMVADETNSYLVEQDDGSYIFYFNGLEIPVPKEEVDAGYYSDYPIYDEKQ